MKNVMEDYENKRELYQTISRVDEALEEKGSLTLTEVYGILGMDCKDDSNDDGAYIWSSGEKVLEIVSGQLKLVMPEKRNINFDITEEE